MGKGARVKSRKKGTMIKGGEKREGLRMGKWEGGKGG